MKKTLPIFILLISLITFANDGGKLIVEQDGFIVEVMYFEEGDRLKLFEIETGDHVLSKTHAQIDLSFLSVGSYLLENNQGQSIGIQKRRISFRA